jgi:mannose-6-phosphate isomerase-like protein (cupin superfamily)
MLTAELVNHVDEGVAMAVVSAPSEHTHELGGTRFTSLATPSRGSSETSVWLVEIAPGTAGTPHRLTREEVFVVLSGRAEVRLDGEVSVAGAGDAIVVPAAVPFALAPVDGEPLRALCCLPVGGQGQLADGEPFTPPWAE